MKKELIFTFALALSGMTFAGPFAYVTNYGAPSVSIVDLAANEAIGYVDNGEFDITNPVDVRHTPDGTKAYLIADFSNAMFVIDTSTDSIVSQIDSSTFNFSAPVIVRFTPDGTKAYVSNEASNTVSIIDVASDTITGYVNDSDGTFNLPIGIAFSPDGMLAYVANYNGNSISIIDVATDTVTGMIDTNLFSLVQPTFLHFVGNDKAYVTSLNSGQVGIIDVTTAAVTGYVDPGANVFVQPFSIACTSDGQQDIVIDPGILQAFAWSPSTDILANVVNGFNSPRLFDISTDNAQVYVSDVGDNVVYIIDLNTYSITGSLDGASFPFNIPYAISVSP